MPRVIASHLVGLPQNSVWSHAGVVECAKQTSLVLVVSLAGNQADILGQTFMRRLESVRLNGAAELYGFLQQMIEQMTRQGVMLSCACAMISDNKLIVATWRGSTVLRRAGVTSRLLSSASQIGILEGLLSNDDVLVLCTTGAARYQTELCQRLADGFGPDVVRQAINQEIESDNQAASIAMTFIVPKIDQNQVDVQPQPVLKQPTQPETETENSIETDLNNQVDISSSTTSSEIIEDVNPLSGSEMKTSKGIFNQFSKIVINIFRLIFTILKWWGIKLKLILLLLLKFRPRHLKQVSQLITTSPRKTGTTIKWFWDVLTGKRVYLSDTPNNPRRLVMWAIFAGLFMVIMIMAIWWWRDSRLASAQLAPFVAARENIESLTNSDVFQARILAINLRSELTSQATTSGISRNLRRITKQEIARVDQILQTLAQKTELQELSVYLDLNTIVPGFLAELSSAGASQAAVLDIGQKQLIWLNLTEINHFASPIDFDEFPKSMVLLNDQTPAILAAGISTIVDEKVQKIIEEGDSNREANILAVFEDTIYVFNPVKRNIFRYNKTKDGYGKPVGWLIEPLGVAFEDVTSMVVDGQIWLGTNKGEIKLFQAGRAQSFDIKNLSQPLTEPIAVTTSPDNPYLYVLDNSNSRVVVIDKISGEVRREIVSLSLKSVSNLLVTGRGVFGVSGSLIYQLPD